MSLALEKSMSIVSRAKVGVAEELEPPKLTAHASCADTVAQYDIALLRLQEPLPGAGLGPQASVFRGPSKVVSTLNTKATVGSADGTGVGRDGSLEGCDDGCEEGFEGREDGCTDGRTDGCVVGRSLGLEDGCEVGAQGFMSGFILS